MHVGQILALGVRGKSWRWLGLLLVAGTLGSFAQTQQGGMGNPRSGGVQSVPDGTATSVGGRSSNDPFRQGQQGPLGDNNGLAAKQFSALNAERQKALVSDTQKLVRLAQELKDEIGASKSGSLTPEQLRKIANIEKLAHNVKQKMSLTLGPGPTLRDEIDPTAR